MDGVSLSGSEMMSGVIRCNNGVPSLLFHDGNNGWDVKPGQSTTDGFNALVSRSTINVGSST